MSSFKTALLFCWEKLDCHSQYCLKFGIQSSFTEDISLFFWRRKEPLFTPRFSHVFVLWSDSGCKEPLGMNRQQERVRRTSSKSLNNSLCYEYSTINQRHAMVWRLSKRMDPHCIYLHREYAHFTQNYISSQNDYAARTGRRVIKDASCYTVFTCSKIWIDITIIIIHLN